MPITTSAVISEKDIAEACQDGRLNIVLILSHLSDSAYISRNGPLPQNDTTTGNAAVGAIGVIEVLKDYLLARVRHIHTVKDHWRQT